MEKIELKIVGLSYSQTQSGAYALVLSEKIGSRRLPIIIGGFEAQSIAIELENMKPSRPLTHDLFKSFVDAFHVSVNEVLIYNLVEGVFYARLICEKEGQIVEIDARTSDAIAIAIRTQSPVYTYENILSSAGIQLEDGEESTDLNPEEEIVENTAETKSNTLSVEELEKLLEEALENEDYEKASELRDEINKRKEN